jgi:hypothetical protein
MKNNKPVKIQKIQRRPVLGDLDKLRKIKDDGYMDIEENRNIDDIDAPTNEEHLKTAYRIKLAKWIMTVFLITLIGAGVFYNSRDLTAVNFNQLLRYINRQSPGRAARAEFYIDLDEVSAVSFHRNNIAAIRRNRLDIYDINGRRNIISRHIYSNPVIRSSDRYIIAYDLGMNKMEIFNSFSRVYEYKGADPILGAQVTDTGNIVYITSERGYRSAVYVMNSSFDIIFKCKFGEDFVVSADIDDRAQRLAVAGFNARNGDYLSRISLYETNVEEPVRQIEVIGEKPYGVKLTESGVFAVFENSFRAYDPGGNAVLNYDFAFRDIRAISLTPQAAAVVLNERTLGTNDRILIFGGNGSILYDDTVDAEIRSAEFSRDHKFLYFLTRSGLYRIDTEKKTVEFVTDEYDETTNNIVYANDKNIFLSGLVKINIIEVD